MRWSGTKPPTSDRDACRLLKIPPNGCGIARLVFGLLCAGLVVLVAVPTASARTSFVYFGTYTNDLSRGVYVSRLDSDTGHLSPPELAAETMSPCFLAVSPDGKHLYTADSVAHFNGEPAGSVSAFSINRQSGHLTLLNRKSSSGAGPCHVSVNPTATVLLTANYGGGSVKSFRLNPDGSIGADGTVLQQAGTSVNPNRQTAPHAHFIESDPSGRFALSCNLGADKVFVYRLDSATATLAEESSATVPPGAGARHLAFSPDGRFAYVVNEMGCSVTLFSWNADAGKLVAVETVSALPPSVAVRPDYTAAEVVAYGRFVYVSIRGHDSVSVLSADAQSGRLTLVQNIPSGGRVPRGLGIDPTGRWLITGNQTSDNAVEFEIEPHTGRLTATGTDLKIGSPVDVKFVPCGG
jgi:6-phosphogluconolactonase